MKKQSSSFAQIKRNQKQPKLFKSRILERLTYSKPSFIIGMYATITVVMIWQFFQPSHKDANAGLALGLGAVGLATWTLAEYLLHRFLYHHPMDASYHRGIQYVFHGIHHEYPNDNDRIVLPAIPSLMIASVLLGVFYFIFELIWGQGWWAWAFAPGFLNGYLIYMMVHYTVHTVPTPKRLNFWWKHHNIHHFQQHDRAFGVTTPLWDWIFRTMPGKGRRTVFEQ
jgi:sterol desaturase/sphingolipid hydroxylase (fatty acid hydroxylase superfamily)